MSRTRKTPLERFEEKYEVQADGCWLWFGAGAVGDARYGSFYLPTYPHERSKHMVAAHKASLWLYRGIVPGEGEEVLHSCDRGLCVNPDHLSVGTHQDNMDDMKAKGRLVLGRQKMRQEDVVTARQMRENGIQVKDIATQFGVSSSQMSRVTAGVQPKWKRVCS